MQPLRVAIVCLLASLALAACGDDAPSAESGGRVTVFAAASLTDAFTALGAAFERENPGTSIELNFGGSSGLREQILSGAPADVFASANESNMAAVVEAGLADEPEIFARNRLAIAVPAGNPAGITGLEDFADGELLLGMCAAEVPCGDFGRQVLANAGVEPALDTEEPDVRALVTKIGADELDAGIVYVSDVAATNPLVDRIDIPDEVNVVAAYPIATLRDATNPDTAAAFLAFVRSNVGRRILADFGFEATA